MSLSVNPSKSLALLTLVTCSALLSACVSTPLSQQSAKQIAATALGSKMLKTSYEMTSTTHLSFEQLAPEANDAQDDQSDLSDQAKIEVATYRGPNAAAKPIDATEQRSMMAVIAADASFDTLVEPEGVAGVGAEEALKIKQQVYEAVYAELADEGDTFDMIDRAALTAQDTVIAELEPQAQGYFDMTPEELDLIHAELGKSLDDQIELSYQVDEQVYGRLDDSFSPSSPTSLAKAPSKLLQKFINDPVFIDALNQYSLAPVYIEQHAAYLPRQSKLSAVQRYGFDNDYLKAEIMVPIELNWEELSLTLDPGAALPFAPIFISETSNFLADYTPGDSVRVRVPEKWVDEPTRRLIIDTLLASIDQTLNGLDESLFRRVSLSGEARKMGARTAIAMDLSAEDQLKILASLIKNSIEQFDQKLPDSGLSAAKIQKYTEFSNKASAVADKAIGNLQSNSEMKKLLEKQLGTVSAILYIDSKSRLTGTSFERSTVLLNDEGKRVAVKSATQLDISNFGRAKAPYAPKADQIIDGNQVFSQLKQKFKPKSVAGKPAKMTPEQIKQALMSPLPASSEGKLAPAATQPAALNSTQGIDTQSFDQLNEKEKAQVRADFCEEYLRFNVSSADKKSKSLKQVSQTTLSGAEAGASAAGAVFYQYLSKSYQDPNIDCTAYSGS